MVINNIIEFTKLRERFYEKHNEILKQEMAENHLFFNTILKTRAWNNEMKLRSVLRLVLDV